MLRDQQSGHQMVQRRGFVYLFKVGRILEWKWTRNVRDNGFPETSPKQIIVFSYYYATGSYPTHFRGDIV